MADHEHNPMALTGQSPQAFSNQCGTDPSPLSRRNDRQRRKRQARHGGSRPHDFEIAEQDMPDDLAGHVGDQRQPSETLDPQSVNQFAFVPAAEGRLVDRPDRRKILGAF